LWERLDEVVAELARTVEDVDRATGLLTRDAVVEIRWNLTSGLSRQDEPDDGSQLRLWKTR